MVLESANCTECRTEIWHNDNYCQECGSRTSFLAQRDTQWRKAPAGPSWNREPVEPLWQKPAEPSFSKSVESSWNQSTEPTPIRSFVQSTSAPQQVPMSEPATKPTQSAPPPPPLPPVAPVVPEVVVKEPEVKVAPPITSPVIKPVVPVASTPAPTPVSGTAPIPTAAPKAEPPVVQVPKPTPQPEVNFVPPVPEKPRSIEPAAVKEEDTVLKARWTALESPLLRPRMSDEADEKKQPEEIIHKIKITNILWLCVCFLAGILIYCLFDIVKMTILKPDTGTVKQQVVVPEAKLIETKPIETKAIEPKAVETKPEELEAAVPIKAVSVQPVVSAPAAPKPVIKPVTPKLPVKPTAKVLPPVKQPKLAPLTKLPAAAKPKPMPSVVHPEVVQPRASVDQNNPTRTRTVWQAPTSSVLPSPPARPVSSKSPVISKGTGGDLARYNRLLADYFSRAGNGSFGDESSEPPTYSEWLSRGKPEF
ncbi:MAG: hypothetical protein K2X29_08615 [Candidatus Obscuribacterales bacterium]|nr:hypothetical protein [Candidatus Obscuribacterales bacterium]